MFLPLRAYFIARRLGLRDRGNVQDADLWQPEQKEYVACYLVHTFCGTRLRVGILKTNGRTVHWCYRCEGVVSDDDDDDRDGQLTQPDPLPDEGEPFPSEVRTEATRIIERVK